MKSFLRTFLLTGIPFGIFWGFYFGSGDGFWPALWIGVVAGIFAGLFGAIVRTYRQNRVSDSPPVLNDEVLVRKSRADRDGMPGWLYLTDRRLLFEGFASDETAPEVSTLFEHRPEETAHQFSIPIHAISDAVVSRSLGVLARLEVVLDDGRTEYFVTEDLADWVDNIAAARQKYLDEPRSENMRLFP